MLNNTYAFRTNAVHAGEAPDPATGAIAPILVRTKTYKQPEFGKEGTWQYSRGKNPTRSFLEEKLKTLEGESDAEAFVFGSGVAAEAMLFLTLDPGDNVICSREIYGGTYRLLTGLFNRFGITSSFVDLGNVEEIRKAKTDRTKYIFVETPTNPSLEIIDLERVNQIAKELGLSWIADMTFSPPNVTRAFEYGAETVIHSLSKYIAGHNDVLGGAVITKNKLLAEKLWFMQRAVGAILSPDECYRVLQGVKTLSYRWEGTSKTALSVAEFLQKDSRVKRVLYPGLKSHPKHDIAKKQMKGGFGSVISFELKTEDKREIEKFVNELTKNDVVVYGESLASPETILAYPPLMSHKSLPKEERYKLGITDGFFRLSVGFEDDSDIKNEFERALKQIHINKKSRNFTPA